MHFPILLTLSLLVFVSVAFSQAPPPPPAPLIYSPPASSELLEFTADDGSFSATFPGEPVKNINTQGQATVTTYRVYRKGSTAMVGITAVAVDLSDRKDEVFSLIRDSLGQRERTKIVTEREIELGGFTGKEFEVNYGLQYGVLRIYIVGAKIVEIQCDVTNWSLLGDKVKNEWRTEANRFFSSFTINK